MTDEALPDTEPTEAHRDRVKRALRSRARLDAIRRTGLDKPSDASVPSFHRAARMAALSLGAPVAQVNLLTDSAQVPLAVHVEPPDDPAVWRAHRQSGSSYCKYVVWTRQPFIVEDAHAHSLVRQANATRDLSIAAYLGVPIRAPSLGADPGAVIGSLCVLDHVPRQWSSENVEVMMDLASTISEEIERRIHLREEVAGGAALAMRVLQHVGVAVITTDADGVTTFANPAALALLGYTAPEMVGRDQHALIHHSRPDGSRYPESDCPNYKGRREAKSVHAANDTFWRSDGQPITVDSMMSPIIDRGEVIGSVLTFHDVTARHATEEAEHSGRITAEAANRAKSALVAELSGELRATLQALTNNLEQMERSLIATASPEQRTELANMRRSVAHLDALVDNMSSFASIDRYTESPD